MGSKIAFVFAAIIILGVGLYVYTSGVASHPGTSGYLSTLFPPSATYGPPTAVTPQPLSPSTPTVITAVPAPSINPSDIPPGFTAAQLSPYFHQVRFDGVSPSGPGYNGQINFYASPNQNVSNIDVTGWEIKTNRGGEFIPQAVNIYDASGVTPPTDIRLTSGDTLSLYSSSAPVNLRLNECVGYIPDPTQFNPQLPANCPYEGNDPQIKSFTGACQNYISSIGSCQQPNMNNLPISQSDYACINFLETHYTYSSCLQEHETDPNFLSHQVWVWMGASPLDQFHDNVELLDGNGLLVDLYSY